MEPKPGKTPKPEDKVIENNEEGLFPENDTSEDEVIETVDERFNERGIGARAVRGPFGIY